MTNILVVERLTILNFFIVVIYKIFKFEVYIFKSSKKLTVSLKSAKAISLMPLLFKYVNNSSVFRFPAPRPVVHRPGRCRDRFRRRHLRSWSGRHHRGGDSRERPDQVRRPHRRSPEHHLAAPWRR